MTSHRFRSLLPTDSSRVPSAARHAVAASSVASNAASAVVALAIAPANAEFQQAVYQAAYAAAKQQVAAERLVRRFSSQAYRWN